MEPPNSAAGEIGDGELEEKLGEDSGVLSSLRQLATRQPFLAHLRYFIVGDGKTGTVTCWYSLMPGNGRQHGSVHAHGDEYLWQVRLPQLRSERIGLAALQRFAFESSGVKPLVVYTFREPISRTISAFFENLASFTQGWSGEEKASVERLCGALGENFLTEDYHLCDHPDFLGGLDVYSRDFDKERGWSLYESEYARVLCLKFERMQRWPEAFEAVLLPEEREDYRWRAGYLSENKSYYELYQQVKATFQPPAELLYRKLRLHDRFLQHFYSEAEIAALSQKWYSRALLEAPRTLETETKL